MNNLTEKLKSVGKIIGVILAVFLLWAIFTLITNQKSSTLSNSVGSGQNMPTTGVSRMSIPGEIADMEIMKDDMASYDEGMMMSEETTSSQASAPEPDLTEKRVIKNGNLTLKVENTERSAQEISEIVKNENGEVFSTNFFERIKGQKSGNITVKVPVENFESALSQIKEVATQVVSESTTGQDVTERFTDLQAQLKNKRAEEESFVKILDRAGDIEDVLAVTKQISRVRGEIERLEGQIRFMESQTDMSTITVALSEDIEISPIQNDWRPWQVAKKAFSDLIGNIQDFADNTIRFIIVGIPSMIPFLLFLGLVYWIGKKVWMKFKN